MKPLSRGTATTTILPPLFGINTNNNNNNNNPVKLLSPPKCPRYPFTSPDGRDLPYYWIRKKDDPKLGPQIRSYLLEENKYCEKILGSAPEILFEEMKSRMKESDAWVPSRHRNYFYYRVEEEGNEYPLYYRRHVCADPNFPSKVSKSMALDPENATIEKNLSGTQLILDLNAFARDEEKDFVCVGNQVTSPNDHRILFSLDLSDGREVFTLIVWEYPDALIEVAAAESEESMNSSSSSSSNSGTVVSISKGKKKRILRMDGTEKDSKIRFGAEIAWGNDEVFFYTKLDESLRPFQVWRHDFCPPDGEPSDVLIFEEKDETFLIGFLERSTDECVVMFSSFSKMSSEDWYIPTSNPRLPWRCIRKRRPFVEYYAVHHRSFFVPCLEAGTSSAASSTLPPKQVPHTWISQPTWLIFHNYGDAINFQLDYAKSDVNCDLHLSEPEKISNDHTIIFRRRLDAAEKAGKHFGGSNIKRKKEAVIAAAAAITFNNDNNNSSQQQQQVQSSTSENSNDSSGIDHSANINSSSSSSSSTSSSPLDHHHHHNHFDANVVIPPASETGAFSPVPHPATQQNLYSTEAPGQKHPPQYFSVEGKKFPFLYKHETYHRWRSFICYDPAYTIEHIYTMKDFAVIEARHGGFPKLLLVPNFARPNTIQQLRYAEASTRIDAKLPPLYQRYISWSWALRVNNATKTNKNGKLFTNSNNNKWSSSSPDQQQQKQEFHIGVETDPVQLELIDRTTSIGLSEIYSFEDHTLRVTANNILYPHCELDVIVDFSRFDTQNHQALFDKDASVSIIAQDEKLPYMIETLKFHPVKASGSKPYDPSQYAVALEWVTATKSTCDPQDREMNIFGGEDGKTPMPVKIPVLLRFKKQLCHKFLAEMDPTRRGIFALQQQQLLILNNSNNNNSNGNDNNMMNERKNQTNPNTSANASSSNSNNNSNNTNSSSSSTIYHKEFGNPLVMWGYAGYGDPTVGVTEAGELNTSLLSLLDRGVVYAEAGVRGGNEMGNHWHNAGRLEHKMNSFTDFIDCGEALIERGWAHPQKLAIRGCSAGGLLVGAATSLRPDLWCAVSADVPFVDAITTMGMDIHGRMDPNGRFLPLCKEETLEWGFPCIFEGCPASNRREYECMLKYSPTDNIPSKDSVMPHMYIETGFEDCRVQYFEPASWAALLRYNWEPASKEAGRILMHKTNFCSGHEGAAGRYGACKQIAGECAFFLGAFGIPCTSLEK